jgi:magnesium transporter
MLRIYHYTTDRLVPTEVVDAAVKPALLRNGAIWLDLINPTVEEDRLVENMLGLSLPTREEMQEIEVSARLYNEAGAEFMTITAVTHMDSDEPAHTPITFVLKGPALATVRYMEPRAFASFAARAQKASAVPCASGEQVMLGLIDSLTDRMADALERVGMEVDTISREVFRGKKRIGTGSPRNLQATLEQIGRNGDFLTKVRESLVSINRLLTYHSSTTDAADKKATKEARARIKTLHRDVLALSDQSTFLSQKINFLLDATLGLINLEQNQIIKIFSVAAVVFLPPTLVASIYGMNFEHMPELKWVFGYPAAVTVMLLSAALPYLWFKRRGWL